MKDDIVQNKANVCNTRPEKREQEEYQESSYSRKDTVCNEEQSLIYTIDTNITTTTIKYAVSEYYFTKH